MLSDHTTSMADVSASRTACDPHQYERVIVDVFAADTDEVIRGGCLGIVAIQDGVQHAPANAVHTGQYRRWQPMPQTKGVERQKACAGAAAAGELGTDSVVAGEPGYLNLVEVGSKHAGQLVGREQVDVEGIFEVGGFIGCQNDEHTIVAQHAGAVGHMPLRIGEVFDDVRRTHPRHRCRVHGQNSGVSTDPMVEAASSLSGCGRVVVDAGHRAVRSHQRCRFSAGATPNIDSFTAADDIVDQSVARVVQRDQRCGCVITDGALAGG